MRIQANGININYESKGEGDAIILTHGIGGDLTGWAPQMEGLSRYFRVIAYDARGHGRSDKPPGEEYPLETFADDIAGLMDALGIQKAAILGLSMGGFISQQFALKYPQCVSALILCNTLSKYYPEKAGYFLERRAELALTGGMAAVQEQIDAGKLMGNRNQTAEDRQRLLRNDPHGFAAACRGLSKLNLTHRIHEIKAPTLVLVGAQDEITPPRASERIHQMIARSEYRIIDNCTHSSNKDQPEMFNFVVSEFVTRSLGRKGGLLLKDAAFSPLAL